MYYLDENIWLDKIVGNNKISREKRKELGSQNRLFIAPLVTGNLGDIEIQSDIEKIAFEEAADQYKNGKNGLHSYYGLKKLLAIHYKNKKVYIIDNHNHAFYCRAKSLNDGEIQNGLDLIHIDQHSDLGIPDSYISSNDIQDMSKVALYTNEVLQVGNFIKAAIQCGLISHDIQIRTEYALLNFDGMKQNADYILDIDLDFRAPEMNIESFSQSISIIKKLISDPRVKVVTIATSPYFLDQTEAVSLLKKLFD